MDITGQCIHYVIARNAILLYLDLMILVFASGW